MNSEELRNLFANLLAKSMNIDFKESVHPSFVDIIKQLSPTDALNLKYINQVQSAPIANIRATLDNINSNGQEVFTNLFIDNPHCTNDDLNSISITNLYRLGLITTMYSSYLLEKSYDHFYSNPTYISAKEYFTSTNTQNTTGYTYVEIIQGVVQITPLGKSFCSICIVD